MPHNYAELKSLACELCDYFQSKRPKKKRTLEALFQRAFMEAVCLALVYAFADHMAARNPATPTRSLAHPQPRGPRP